MRKWPRYRGKSADIAADSEHGGGSDGGERLARRIAERGQRADR